MSDTPRSSAFPRLYALVSAKVTSYATQARELRASAWGFATQGNYRVFVQAGKAQALIDIAAELEVELEKMRAEYPDEFPSKADDGPVNGRRE